MLNLAALYDLLPPLSPTSNELARFATCDILSFKRYRLAKDAYGAPAILISIEDSRGKRRAASIVLENLTVQHEVSCRIVDKEGTEHGCFTIIQCTSNEKALHTYFLSVITPLITLLGPDPSRQSINLVIKSVVELFHALTQAPRKTTQGLWAELFLIARASQPAKLALAWHPSPEDRYDFSSGNQRLEVKSTASRVRQHHFTLEQLSPPAGTSLIIASLLVERSDAGISLGELIELIRSRVSSRPEVLSHVNRVVALTLGNSWQKAVEERFNFKAAEQFLAFYKAEDIPKIRQEDVPSDVSGVHFQSNLTRLTPLVPSSLRTAGELFKAALIQQPKSV